MASTIASSPTKALAQALETAHALVDMGVPVFACRMDKDGNPFPPKDYQNLEPDHGQVDKWRRGMALCAVTGVVFDVLDCDPRNGGRMSLTRLSRELGDDGPDVYWEVRTASGGSHRWITPLRIGTRPGFRPGLDLKGGLSNGESRGFVFIPPTVRPSKDPATYGDRMPYLARTDLSEPTGTVCTALREAVERGLGGEEDVFGTHAGRQTTEALRGACLTAQAGEQRTALMAYVAELQRRGYDKEDALRLLRDLVGTMPVFDARKPWYPARGANPDAHLLSLFYRDGRIVPDATSSERVMLSELKPMSPRVSGGLTSYEEVAQAITRWLWRRYLAIGDITIMDADPGTGKSLVTLDVAARFSRGWAMPGEESSSVGAGNVLILAPEDRKEVIQARLMAAGADLTRCYFPSVGTVGKGRGRKATYEGSLLTFPDRIDVFARWIESYGIGLVVIDPIAAFLSETVNSHNDASVRRALEPLAVVLGECKASAFLLRHLNKDTGKDIRYRGGGSTAFGAVSRIQLFAAELPPGVGVGATHGIATVKNNHLAKRPNTALTYEICDSGIVADEDGNMVPMLKWHGELELDIQRLAGGNGTARKGPEAETQKEVEVVLEQLFGVREAWPVKEAMAELAAAGVSASRPTLDKVRHKLGIASRQEWNEEGGVRGWVWTVAKERVSGQKRGRGAGDSVQYENGARKPVREAE